MLNKVATHTNANPVLSSSKTDSVFEPRWGKNVIFLRPLGLGHGKNRGLYQKLDRNTWKGRVHQRREKGERQRR